mgnify:CR=1 FL=1
MSNNERVNIMCNNNREQEGNCIAEILKVICILQQNACPDNSLDSCDRPMLGGGSSNCLVCNTRPIMLYTCCGNGVPISMPTSKDVTCTCSNTSLDSSCAECSNVFRVEKVDGCCCTFRVLAVNPDQSCCNSQPYIATNSFFTMNLNCCCIIRCLNDCYVDCVC